MKVEYDNSGDVGLGQAEDGTEGHEGHKEELECSFIEDERSRPEATRQSTFLNLGQLSAVSDQQSASQKQPCMKKYVVVECPHGWPVIHNAEILRAPVFRHADWSVMTYVKIACRHILPVLTNWPAVRVPHPPLDPASSILEYPSRFPAPRANRLLCPPPCPRRLPRSSVRTPSSPPGR